MDVNARIRFHMEQRGWTEYRLAKESGLAQTTVANLFTRNTLPSIPTLEAICAAFGITLSDFFSEDTPARGAGMPNTLWGKLTPKQRTLFTDLLHEFTNCNG